MKCPGYLGMLDVRNPARWGRPMELTTRALDLGGPPLIAAVGIFLLPLLPLGVLEVLTAWTLLSVPVGIVLGHCALSEDHHHL